MGDVIRDVLDMQLVDRNGARMGKVDGITMVIREGKPPRLATLDVGPAVAARRLHPRLAVWIEVIESRLGIAKGRPVHVPWSAIRKVGRDVQVDLVWNETPLAEWERWVNERVIGRIPGH